ncbi:hypothetical protein [Carboxylicivirga sp. RSCT41]|uniref:hypothetical protein n=1 Tax=Carboxylicivirga agarovorans TaxID=3417570 RepID=UPI003D34F434
MLLKRLTSILLSFSILLYSCSGYKEVTCTNKGVDKARSVYLHVDKRYYALDSIQDFTSYYSAKATLTEKEAIGKKSVTIFANKVGIEQTDQEFVHVLIDKSEVDHYSKTVRKSEKPLTIIGLAAIAILIVWVAIDHEENHMKIHAHE